MAYVAAVAAVRIQSWIARTRELRYVRGASKALTQATSRAQIETRANLPAGVRIDTDTNDVAGVCVLRSTDRNALDLAVNTLLDHFQRQLPGVEWDAWRAQATSYVVAYDAVHGKGGRGAADVKRWPRRLPLSLHLPFVEPCVGCAHELATTAVHVPGPKEAIPKLEGIGPDCAVRHAAGANDMFKDFDELAHQGRLGLTEGRRDAANHLATICADGNRVGDFFSAVAALKQPTIQAQLSNAIDNALRTAVAEAEGCGPSGAVVAMRHFVGGDDVFASVAAPFAWKYVEILGRRFEEEFGKGVEQVFNSEPSNTELRELAASQSGRTVLEAAKAVSLGIGVAFANASHPIADCRESALAAEANAKRAMRGKVSAASWVDITVEPSVGLAGGTIPAGRCVTIEQLGKDLAVDDPVLVMTPSARNLLVTLLRPRPKDTAFDIDRAVRAWATRVGRLEALRPFLPDKGDNDADARIELLRHTAERSRWWPKKEDEASEEEQ